MATNTGRTTNRWVRMAIADSGDTLREIPIDSINDIGLNSESKDQTALQDAVKNSLSGHPSAPIKITGPVDTSVVAALAASGLTPTLSGSHTVLAGICGDNKPHTCFIMFGIRHLWETGEPVFGLQRDSSKNSGYHCLSYTINGDKYTANLEPMGPVAPSWGTAQLTVGA
jgi:hypothetical protein